MNKVKRAARKRYLRQSIETGLIVQPVRKEAPNHIGESTLPTGFGLKRNTHTAARESEFMDEVARPAASRYRHPVSTQIPGSRRGNDWVRENRRRRTCGLPQKRVLPFDLGVFDPIDRTVAVTLEGGVIEKRAV